MKQVRGQQIFADDRGRITHICAGPSWCEVNRFSSVAGAVRGNHYHKQTHELIFILEGRVRFDLLDVRSGERRRCEVGPDEGLWIEPYEHHTLTVLEDTHWIAMLSRVFDDSAPDLHRLED